MPIDLHCHSRISDGSLAIPDLVLYAKNLGVKALAITDHDTAIGYWEAASVCRDYGIEYLGGVEISAYDYKRRRKVHLLGYLLDQPELVDRACRMMQRQRQMNSRWTVDALQLAGYPVTWDYVSRIAIGSTNIYKQHIMHALMEMGYTTTIRGELYQKLFGKPRGGQCEGALARKMDYLDVFEALQVIKEAGGVSVLAHPAEYDSWELIPELAAVGLNGLEAWHPHHDAAAVTRIQELAERYGLILTGGSDFHGMYDGVTNRAGSCSTPEDWLEQLYKAKSERRRAVAAWNR